MKLSDSMLIAGGGIGGLAAALALAARGFRSRVLEQAPEFKEVGAGIQLGPNSWKALRIIGVDAAVKKLAVFPGALIMRDAVTAEDVVRIPLEGFEARFGAPYALIHRADLLDALVAAAKQSPLITLETSQKVKRYEDDGQTVTVETETGRKVTGAALIGADGLWSTVRAQLLNDGPPRVSGHITYRAVLPASDVPERLQHWNMILWGGPKCHLVYYRLRNGELFNLVAVFHSNRYEEGWNSYGDPQELKQHYEATHPDVRLLLGKISEWRMWVLCDRAPAKDWSKGRVALLGDAAHPTLQYIAQGAGMSIEDGVCLARKLDEGANIEGALTAYWKERYLRTGRIQLSSRLYGEFFHAEGVAREIRNEFVRNMGPDGLAWVYDYRP